MFRCRASLMAPTVYDDAGVHGALTCVREFPAFERVLERPVICAWYDRVAALRRRVEAA